MKKITSLLLSFVMIVTMFSAFTFPVFADSNVTTMSGTGSCHLEMTKQEYKFIEFTPSVSDNYTFISELSNEVSNKAKLIAILYCGKKEMASDYRLLEGGGNFCISSYLEANKTYQLKIQLQNVNNGSADIYLLKEVTLNNFNDITGNCIISKPGSYSCEQIILDSDSTLTIGRNASIKVNNGFINKGKIKLSGSLDLSQTSIYESGEITVGKFGYLIGPDLDKISNGYLITWHKNGGTFIDSNVDSSSSEDTYHTIYLYGNTVEMYEITKPNYDFIGWYDNPDFTGEPVTEIKENEKGDKDLYAKFCNHSQFTKINIDKSGNDQFSTDSDYYYQCDNCGWYFKDNTSQNMIGDKKALNEWLVEWYNNNIISCHYIDVSLDDSNKVTSIEKVINSNDFNTINTTDTVWGNQNDDTWYVCTADITIDNRVNIVGKVCLIIRDNCTLTVNNGIRLIEGNTLSIYAQSNGANCGKLIANGYNGNAAIGGNGGFDTSNSKSNDESYTNAENGGIFNVCGGIINATGNGTVGIGGGNGYKGKDKNDHTYMNIIGPNDGGRGGNGGNGCIVNIYSGTVNAVGTIGIGGGNGGDGGNGCVVENESSIGGYRGKNGNGGDGGSAGKLNIFAGSVTCSSDQCAFGGGNGGIGAKGSNTYKEIPAESKGAPGKNGDSGQLNIAASCSVSGSANETQLSVTGANMNVGSILSSSELWIVIGIVVIAVGVVTALIIDKKKKKPVLADDKNIDEE